MAGADDPGWIAALPLAGFWSAHGAVARNGIVLTRKIFIGFTLAILIFGVVLVLSTPSLPKEKDVPPLVALGLAVAGAMGISLSAWARSRRLDGSSPATLAASYRTAFFIGLAASEVPALLAFVAAVELGRVWLYGIGLASALAGFALQAPTRANLERRQEAVTAAGSPLSLTEALAGLPRPRASA